MFRADVTSRTLRRRFVATSCVLVLALIIVTAVSMASGYSRHRYGHRGAWSTSYHEADVPTAAEQAATLAATQSYRRLVVTSAQEFAQSSAAIVSALARGDVSAARTDELLAQGAYDVLRPALTVAVSSPPQIDALVADQPPGLVPGGLHAVERALWSAHPRDALAAATAVSAQAAIMPFLVFRTVLSPSDICARLSELLGWTVENVIDSSQEQYSHFDSVDVAASVRAASTMVTGLLGIGRLVAPAASMDLLRTTRQLVVVERSVGSSALDASIPRDVWTRLAASMDAVVLKAAQLGGELAGFGTGRSYA